MSSNCTATVRAPIRCDLIFGANSQLRTISEVYAATTGEARFVRDFVAVWNKAMMADRYDTHQ